jgi:hypothetical protein
VLAIGAAGVAAAALPLFVLPVAGPAQAARILFLVPPEPGSLPLGVAIDRWSGHMAVLTGVDASAARSLYAKGALLVYPLRRAGCLGLIPSLDDRNP